uniref:Solute carrier family 26 member 10 n=1 Tax=Canis lupus familiaris TaxID=9615 RepID=A0A8P0S6K7_CANLF
PVGSLLRDDLAPPCQPLRVCAEGCLPEAAHLPRPARHTPQDLSSSFSPRHGFCPPDLGASSVRTLHFFLPRPHLHLVGDRETPVHRDFRGSQPDDGLGRGAAGARTPRGQPERNRERRAGRAAGWRGRGLGLRERGSDAGHVRAAARRPVHLSVRARGQGADQRGRAARARVPAAQPFGAAPPAPDRLLRALQDAGRRADRAAPEQSGRADHLGAQPGAARARQRTEREIPRQAAHPDPGGDRHGASGLCALLHLFPGHKIQRPDSGAAAWGLAGLFSCIVVLSVLLWLGPFFYYLPKAVLACINISSMRQMFFQMQELPQLWRISRMDFAVWMVTWVAVVILSVDLGLAIGVVFSMMTVVCRTQRVQCLALGLAEGTELYRPLRESHKLRKARGLCVLSYPAPLYFGTRGQFRRSLEWQLGLGEAGKEAPKADGPPDAAAEPVRVVVLDCSGITFADAAGAREVVQLASRCRDAGIHLLLAQCHASVLGTLTQAGLLDRVTPEQLFVSVQDAAAHALERLVRTQ